MILALETSCDDTCAAVVTSAGEIRSNVISSQGVHDRFGGVVPEIASRHHLELIGDVVEDALSQAGVSLPDVDLVGVTRGPGLVAALLVGVATAKGLAAAYELPLAPVDHLHGHVAAGFLVGSSASRAASRVVTGGSCARTQDPTCGSATRGAEDKAQRRQGPLECPQDLRTGPLGPEPFEPPFLSLVASGGHTLLARVVDPEPGFEVIGQTLDDAAGEAFDKGARLLGLGYPGGPALERLARDGDPGAFRFPVGERMPGLDFSFAGLKTALLYRVRDLGEREAERRRADLAASYQRAIVESLALRVERALSATGLERLSVGGGVAANGAVRSRMAALGVKLHVPARELCTDNAAMIASAARFVPALPYPEYLDLDVYATGERILVAR